MITGPRGTPYENGCFLFDIYLPMDYNNVAPMVSSMTTNGGKYRYNPNLYANGVSHPGICQSTTSPSIHLTLYLYFPVIYLPLYLPSPLLTFPSVDLPLCLPPPILTFPSTYLPHIITFPYHRFSPGPLPICSPSLYQTNLIPTWMGLTFPERMP